MASMAVAPALSLTPGLKPIQIHQSKSISKGLKLETWVTGLVKISSFTRSSPGRSRSDSMVTILIHRAHSIFIPKKESAFFFREDAWASLSSCLRAISIQEIILSAFILSFLTFQALNYPTLSILTISL